MGGSALELLRNRGILKLDTFEWAGRNNDKKPLPHQKLAKNALFSGESDKDEDILRLEVALRQTDKFGRVLTAKEAFRRLCYDFHGKDAKNLSSIYTDKRANKIQLLQNKLRRPYLVIEGKHNYVH